MITDNVYDPPCCLGAGMTITNHGMIRMASLDGWMSSLGEQRPRLPREAIAYLPFHPEMENENKSILKILLIPSKLLCRKAKNRRFLLFELCLWSGMKILLICLGLLALGFVYVPVCEEFGVRGLDAFDSVSRGSLQALSDIDLLVEFVEPERSPAKWFFGLLH